MKTIQIFLLVFFFMTASLMTSAQDYAGDFGWTGTSTNTSMTTVTACGIQNSIQLHSSQNMHTIYGTNALIPEFSASAVSLITITIQFSEPVCNLRLKINDLDYGPSSNTSAAETITTSPTFSSISPSISPAGPVFVNSGGTLTPPVGTQNTLGWVEFSDPSLSSVTLTYNRSRGYAITLDSMTYDCCKNCICNDKDNILAGTSSIPNNGSTPANVSISSAGVPITRLNVSIPYYKSLANPDCIKCDAPNISNYGKILNLPPIAGVTPTFTGPTTSGSAEIVYEFPTPTVINHSINLNLQFPPTLNLSCCPNSVDYCIKIGLIDKDCKICEKLLCLTSPNTEINNGGGFTPVTQNNNKALLDGPLTKASKLILNPNPASTVLQVTLPAKTEASLEILDLNGRSILTKKVSSDTATLNIAELSQGTYILKYTSGETVLNETFIKQ